MADLVRSHPKRRLRIGVVAATLALHMITSNERADAYEWQVGPGGNCPPQNGIPNAVVVQAWIYGDWNLYSNYGLAGYEYNIPQTTRAYAFATTAYETISSSAGEAGDYLGYVDGSVNTDCGPK